MPGKRVRAMPLTSFLASTEEKRTEEARTVARTEVRTVVRWDCRELLSDRRALIKAVGAYLAMYPSVGSLRMALDILGQCVSDNPVDIFLKYLKPVLIRLEKMGYVELVEGDPVVGIAVVNLVRNDQTRGGGNGSE